MLKDIVLLCLDVEPCRRLCVIYICFFMLFFCAFLYFFGCFFFFFQAEDGIRDRNVTGVQTCALPICSRAYRWGEDGLAGISDEKQRLCFALALWNGKDSILKERLFGLTNSEANHGEDVKEYYFYLDSTPTHSYMKYLYKYPQAPYPYGDLIHNNRQRGRHEFEYELLDTGIFDQDRYFDVFVEYAKGSPEDILVQITVWNRGPEPATLHVLPTVWFRNKWSWGTVSPRPQLRQMERSADVSVIEAVQEKL